MLHEVMGWPGPLTFRQFLAELEWAFIDLNRPGKTESYIIQNTVEVVRARAKDPNDVRLDDPRWHLKFKRPDADGAERKPVDGDEPGGLVGAIRAGRQRRWKQSEQRKAP